MPPSSRSLRAPTWPSISPEEQQRIGRHLVALIAVAMVVIARNLLGMRISDVPPFLLFDVAVAAAALTGGPGPGVVATLASALAARTLTAPEDPAAALGAGGAAFVLFVLQGFFLTFVIGGLRERNTRVEHELSDERDQLTRARHTVRGLQIVERAFDHFAGTVTDTAIVVLDTSGRITDWNRGAERLFGFDAGTMVGDTPVRVVAGETVKPSEFDALLEQALAANEARLDAWLRRADGSRFRSAIVVRPLRPAPGSTTGFTMLVRDLTREHEAETFRTQSLVTQQATQGELDAVAEQLQRVEMVVDPALGDLTGRELLIELVARLRAVLRADAIVLVDTRDTEPALLASEGLAQPRLRPGALRARVAAMRQARRMQIVQNDPERLRETSLLAFADPVLTLVSLPIACEGALLGVLEVAMRRPRRFTDWDATLLRIVADRAAWVLAKLPHDAKSRTA